MNLYVRYFEEEALAHSVDEALDFLHSIPEIELNTETEKDIREYAVGSVGYPKRYKVHQHSYFIIIKTEAETMQDFKDKKALRKAPPKPNDIMEATSALAVIKPGWYEGTFIFKRVTIIPGSGKCQYIDTPFVVACKASCGQECYDRIVDHLISRVDKRCQFPAPKGKYFTFKYLGGIKN